jgi:hypothetical protein
MQVRVKRPLIPGTAGMIQYRPESGQRGGGGGEEAGCCVGPEECLIKGFKRLQERLEVLRRVGACLRSVKVPVKGTW